MRKKANVYVCSKPLQYFNVRNLPKSREHANVLIIEDRFKDAAHFYNTVAKYDSSWDEVLLVNDRRQVFSFCLFKYKPESFYYYLDWFLFPALMLYFLPCKHIYIYEEGFGSYRADSFKRLSAFKKKIRGLLKISEYPGFHPRVEGMFIYCTEYYLKKFRSYTSKRLNALSFNKPFSGMVDECADLARNVFRFDLRQSYPDISQKKVALYITSWPFNESLMEAIKMDEYDYCLIKPHPHIADMHIFDRWKSDRFVIIDSLILSEFLIKQLTDAHNMVDIYHCSSSSVLYIGAHPNIGAVINLTEGSTEFDAIFAGVRAECLV